LRAALVGSMLDSSLHVHDRPDERHESHHNPVVAYLLGRAYSCLRRALYLVTSYNEAHAFADTCLSLPMSERQRMRTHYARGSALLGLDQDRQGIIALNEAIQAAADLPDPGAYAELSWLASTASARSFFYQAASEYGMTTYGILRYLAKDQVSADVDLEISVLVGLASSEFMLARYSAAERHLLLARQLTSPSFHNSRSIASIAWMQSLLYRWSGQPEVALRYALPALDTYIRTAESPSVLGAVGRLSCIATDISLDLAQTVSPEDSPTTHASYLKIAQPYLKRALVTTQQVHDDTGISLALLLQARYLGLARRNVDRVQIIQTVIQKAEQQHEITLLAQAYTTLGQEYTLQGEKELALNCYRRTLDVVAGTDTLAMGAFARRNLLLAREMDE
jgi:tetratricopeptide (TPR) repeat protein